MSDSGSSLFEELMRFRPEGLTANGWAVRAGVSRTIWADLRRHGNPSRRTLEKLLGAAGTSLAEFEALRAGESAPPETAGTGLADAGRGWRGAAPSSIPLFATQLAGEWNGSGSGIALHSIDRLAAIAWLDRPKALADDAGAYAVTMIGEAMWPRFRPGKRLVVSTAAQAMPGDDVLVELVDGGVLIKELVGCSAGAVALRQFNPDVRFEVEGRIVDVIHKVIGEVWSL